MPVIVNVVLWLFVSVTVRAGRTHSLRGKSHSERRDAHRQYAGARHAVNLRADRRAIRDRNRSLDGPVDAWAEADSHRAFRPGRERAAARSGSAARCGEIAAGRDLGDADTQRSAVGNSHGLTRALRPDQLVGKG